MAAEHRLEDDVRFPGAQPVSPVAEDGADELGIADVDDAAAQRQLHGEDVPVAGAAALHEGEGTEHPEQGLDEHRHPRARGQGRGRRRRGLGLAHGLPLIPQ